MALYRTRLLSREEAYAAYPLIRHVAPGLRLAAWNRLASAINAARRPPRRGIVIAEHRAARPVGLFCYSQQADLQRGKVLWVSHFVAFDLLDGQGVVAALSRHLDDLACELGCVAIECVVCDPLGNGSETLVAAGHRRAGTLLVKEFPAARPETAPRPRATLKPLRPASVSAIAGPLSKA